MRLQRTHQQLFRALLWNPISTSRFLTVSPVRHCTVDQINYCRCNEIPRGEGDKIPLQILIFSLFNSHTRNCRGGNAYVALVVFHFFIIHVAVNCGWAIRQTMRACWAAANDNCVSHREHGPAKCSPRR